MEGVGGEWCYILKEFCVCKIIRLGEILPVVKEKPTTE